MVNTFFDGKLLINLERRKDRLEKSYDLFNKYNINNVIRIDAFDGQLLDNDLHKEHKGELGSCISHLNAIKYAKEHSFNNVLIFEDDIAFLEENFHYLDNIISEIPQNYDMIYFGGNHQSVLSRISKHIYKTNRTFALQMYGVNSKIYDYLIDMLEHHISESKKYDKKSKFVSLAGDYFIANHHPNMNVYVGKPHISFQLEDFSDIQFTNVNYDFLK